MGYVFSVTRFWILRATSLMLLVAFMPVAIAQVEAVRYSLDEVFLADGSQMTGAFNWTYTVGDFEGGNGEFTELEIPWRPNGSAPPLEDPGMALTIEDKQIEISLDGNFHDYGLDITLKFEQPLSPTQPSLINLNASFFECCGNGFKDQPFISGSVSPVSLQSVDVDIKPNSRRNPVHPHHDGSASAVAGLNDIVPVVVLSSSTLVGDPIDFVATDIDPATLGFGPAGGGIAPGSTPVMDKDYDSDGIMDAKFKFLMGDTGISCQDTEASIIGETTGNEPFIGTDLIAANCDARCH
jgi:hypothetical protein